MIFGMTMVSVVMSLNSAPELPRMLEAQVILWRDVSPEVKKWPCTVVFRNATDRPLQIATGHFGASYTVWGTTPTGGKTSTVYAEPFIETDDEVKYPKGFVMLEPGGVKTVPIWLTEMPKIADRPLDLQVTIPVYIYSKGKVERLRTTCKVKWSLDSRGTKR